MDKQLDKLKYVPPTLELFEYEVEHGFVGSNEAEQLETLSEITGNQDGSDGTENFHGEWY